MRPPTDPSSTVAARARRSAFALIALVLAGCTSSDGLGERPMPEVLSATSRPTTMPALMTFQTFAVYSTPPAGWAQRTNSIDADSEHITWLSPTGSTAFGTFFFKLPFPVGHDLAFTRGFLVQMRKREGEPEVLEKHWDEQIGGLRFTVRSPKYTVEAKFFVKGLRGYAVYAGTRTDLPVNESELAEARAARESTRFAREVKPTPATKPAA